MTERHEFGAARISAAGVGENLFRLEIEKPQAHGAMTEDALQVPASAAPAKVLFGIERHDGVPAFPHAFAPGIAAEAHTVSKRPYANEFLQLVVRSGNSGSHGVGVIENANRNGQAACRQRRLQIEALHLMEIGGILDDSSANHAGKSQPDGADLLTLG